MKRAFLAVVLVAILVGCGPYRPSATPTETIAIPQVHLGPTATFVPTLNRKPTPTLTPTWTPTPIIYVVKKGDILGQIALDYGVSVEAIMMANGLTNPHLLSIGQKLLIPNEGMLEEMARGGLDVALYTPTPTFPRPTLRPSSIPWEDAGQHIGEEVSVEGLVVSVRKAGGDTFLCFHNPPAGYLTVRIPAEYAGNFISQPEVYYLDHWIIAKGVVERADSGPQITVQKRSQLDVLE